MPLYNINFNKDDSLVRHILLGLISEMNKKIWYYDYHDEDDIRKVEIPFFISMIGSEKFLYEEFLLDDLVDPTKKNAIGNYDKVPRGMVQLESIEINGDELTNKHNYGIYQRDVDGELKSFRAQFRRIPLILSLKATIICDSYLSIMKAMERAIKFMYKTNVYNVDVGTYLEGTYRTRCAYSIPESYDSESPIEFSLEDKKEYHVNFDIELKTFFLVFEKEGEMFAGNRMFEIENNGFVKNETEDVDDVIEIVKDDDNNTLDKQSRS